MKILYVSNLVSNDYFNSLFKISKYKPGQQVQRFHRLILEGLIFNDVEVSTISAPPITKQITNKSFFKSQSEIQNKIIFFHLMVVNVFLIKHIVYFFESMIISIKQFKNNKESHLICDVLNISAVAGALFISKLFKIKSTGIVTDVPSHLASKSKINRYINEVLIRSFDSYIFLTEYMNELINIKQKPYLVVEGLVDQKIREKENSLSNKELELTVMYAGGLEKKYGIEYMVKGFAKASIPNSKLIIFGSGDYTVELEKIVAENPNIRFYGVVKNDEVLEWEFKSHLLVNPRFTQEEYTKYSFPSKNLEYMSVGTPLLTTKLEGMPIEYYNYVYLIEEETVEGFSKELKHILSKPLEEIHQKGIKAKEFVMDYKNNTIQSNRIIDFVRTLNK